MNIFCYRRTLGADLSCLLGVSRGLEPRFGVRASVPLLDGKTDRTEIDMKIGDLLVEAKLTEVDFQSAPLRLIGRYRDFKETLNMPELVRTEQLIRSYQLIRGVLAARTSGGSFCVLCDARRPDLIESWYAVMRAVFDCDLRCRLKLITWQEVASVLPPSLRAFLTTKYGISP